MHERVRHEGLFFQRDSATGRYEDLEFAKGWQGPSPEYRKIEKLELDPLFRAWMKNALFERIARRLIAGPIALYRAVLFTKSAAGGTALPWHQDGGRFWGLDRSPELQIWTALDDCPVDAGCVEVRGRQSHGRSRDRRRRRHLGGAPARGRRRSGERCRCRRAPARGC